jgi:ketosteroid isomerase-like protein
MPENDLREEEIWAAEERYFTSLYAADYDAIIALVHDDYLGWPTGTEHPVDRDGSSRFMRDLIAEPVPCTIRIGREGIRILGDVALTQYVLDVEVRDSSKTETLSSRITHTWVKADVGWLLLGGMSATLRGVWSSADGDSGR